VEEIFRVDTLLLLNGSQKLSFCPLDLEGLRLLMAVIVRLFVCLALLEIVKFP
jgi:hypothetical protein